MNIKGKRVYSEEVEVEVTNADLVKAILKLYDKKYPRPSTDCYISSNGEWKVYSYTHPHNGDDVYISFGVATSEEVEQNRIRRIISELVR